MSIIFEVILYLAVGTFHWWWTQNLSFSGISPDFIFAAALCAAIIAGPVKGAAWGFFLGLYADMLGSGLLGGYALTYTLLAYGVYVLKRHFDMLNPFSQLVSALFLSLLCMLFYQVLSLSFSRLNPLYLKNFLVVPFFNAIAVPVVFQVFYWFKRRTGVL